MIKIDYEKKSIKGYCKAKDFKKELDEFIENLTKDIIRK